MTKLDAISIPSGLVFGIRLIQIQRGRRVFLEIYFPSLSLYYQTPFSFKTPREPQYKAAPISNCGTTDWTETRVHGENVQNFENVTIIPIQTGTLLHVTSSTKHSHS